MSIFKHVGTKRYCGGITLSLPRHYPCITSAFHESIRNHFTLLEKSSHSCLALFNIMKISSPTENAPLDLRLVAVSDGGGGESEFPLTKFEFGEFF